MVTSKTTTTQEGNWEIVIKPFSFIIIQPSQNPFSMKSIFSVYNIFLITSLIAYGYWPTDLATIHKTDILSKIDQSVYSVTSNLQSQKGLP